MEPCDVIIIFQIENVENYMVCVIGTNEFQPRFSMRWFHYNEFTLFFLIKKFGSRHFVSKSAGRFAFYRVFSTDLFHCKFQNCCKHIDLTCFPFIVIDSHFFLFFRLLCIEEFEILFLLDLRSFTARTEHSFYTIATIQFYALINTETPNF